MIVDEKKLTQYWKKSIFKNVLGKNLFNKTLFFSKNKLFLNQDLDTLNLYKKDKETNSKIKKKV